MHGEARTVRIANQVVVDTQVDGLARIVRADHDLRVIDHAHEARRWLPEESNRSDVVGDVERHRRRHVQSRNPVGHNIRGDEAHDRCALGESTEHHFGLRTICGRGKDACARISDSIDGGLKLSGGGIIDRVHPNRLRSDLRSQRVDERLSRGADTRQLGSAAGEYHLSVWARRRARGRQGSTLQQRSRHCRCANQTSDSESPHGLMLTHCDAARALCE